MRRLSPLSALFPYTTLFRSLTCGKVAASVSRASCDSVPGMETPSSKPSAKSATIPPNTIRRANQPAKTFRRECAAQRPREYSAEDTRTPVFTTEYFRYSVVSDTQLYAIQFCIAKCAPLDWRYYRKEFVRES